MTLWAGGDATGAGKSRRDAVKCIWRELMSCLANYRDGLDATAAPGAGPAGSVEQEATDLALQAGTHLTPLTAPHDPRCQGERQADGEVD